MTPEEASAESSGAPSGTAAAGATRRSTGRGRYSRGRRRPRRSGNPLRRLPSVTEAPVESITPGEAEPLREERAEPLPPPFQPAKVESVHAAIEKVTAIIGDLRDVLNDMELVLEYLEDVERQQIADEREIESLQQRLNSMHRRGERHQPHHRSDPRAARESAAAAE